MRNSFGREQTAYVVFCDENSKWWLRWLKPGFRHCFIIIKTSGKFIAIEPLFSCIEFDIIGEEEIELDKFLRSKGHTVVEFQIHRNLNKMFPISIYSCVTICKAYLGIRNQLISTPYQLYRYMIGMKS